MSGYQDVLAMRALPLGGVFDLVEVNYVIVFSTSAAIVVLFLYHLISRVIDSRRRLKDTFVNDKRAVGLITTYVLTTTTADNFADPYLRISGFRLDIWIYLTYTIFSRSFLTRQVLTLLTRNRREAELIGMKRMVTSFGLTIFCQLSVLTQLCQELGTTYSNFVVLGWNKRLLLLLRMLAFLLSVKCSYTSRDWKELVSLFSTEQTKIKHS